jgi:hypothetical protein
VWEIICVETKYMKVKCLDHKFYSSLLVLALRKLIMGGFLKVAFIERNIHTIE